MECLRFRVNDDSPSALTKTSGPIDIFSIHKEAFVQEVPNNVVATYGYDADSRLTSLAYQRGSTTLGNLTYAYDAAGQITQIMGSLARNTLPQPLAAAIYDDANELIQWNGVPLNYDASGNLINDGTNNYVWNARNHLANMNGGSLGYDGSARRTQNLSGTRNLYDGLNPETDLNAHVSITLG